MEYCYKIGKSKVDITGWRGDSSDLDMLFKMIENRCKKKQVKVMDFDNYKKSDVKIVMDDTILFLKIGQYLVKTRTSIFVLSKIDFDRMVTIELE